MSVITPARADVEAIRQQRDCGLTEAYHIATREALLHAIRAAATVDDLKSVLLTIASGYRGPAQR